MRIKAVGVYERDDYRPLETFATKSKAKEYMLAIEGDSSFRDVYAQFYYYLTPDQVLMLSYAEAYNFENKMRQAVEDVRNELARR